MACFKAVIWGRHQCKKPPVSCLEHAVSAGRTREPQFQGARRACRCGLGKLVL